ncbi:hypothetical protein S820908_157 [Synechococcus phage S-CAM9]|uniref:Uncharacterized protein n=1 Tax=Synechococcus phage S-CAM9 TaxID=1883369 RepID=A0A1D8KPI0_9CAUD|nr:hypothetical protein BOW85_gp091 [Synechococcus phage S-CAM9]AOV60304.1 hypothetical protein S050808_157 [Synechococcus phage S-CAM9]AOV60532.1 hypothetical protein S820908_157 [Synechococcus phage S-CAM9]AOV60761.1 hypothetical protein N161109_158 [Synechococcus phage S-CAM9]
MDLWSSMKSFVIYLGRLPEVPKTSLHDVMVDLDVYKALTEV